MWDIPKEGMNESLTEPSFSLTGEFVLMIPISFKFVGFVLTIDDLQLYMYMYDRNPQY